MMKTTLAAAMVLALGFSAATYAQTQRHHTGGGASLAEADNAASNGFKLAEADNAASNGFRQV